MIYEYYCDACECEFEELFTSSEESKTYFEWHPCPTCKDRAERIKISMVSFKFGGTPGNSGSHDLDYPVLDKAVGRSAETRWTGYNERKAKRDKIRKDAGTNSVSVTSSGDVIPTDSGKLGLREKAYKLLRKAKDSESK